MRVLLRIVSLVDGGRTPFDGLFVEEYDPGRDGTSPDGRPMPCHLVATADPERARHFKDHTAAWEYWKKVDPRQPVRPDGRPNRPLTAFTVIVEPATILA